jgi:uncharacterized membrane protein YbhN (UPF0104 family)
LSLVLPAGASDLAKARLGYVTYGSAEEIVVSTVLDKLTAVTAVAAMGIAGALVEEETTFALAAAAVLVVSIIPYVFPKAMPWRLTLRLLAHGDSIDEERLERAARPSRGVLARVVGVSVVGWIVTYAVIYMMALGFDAGVTIWYVLSLAPFATLARLVPVSVGGVGLAEFTLAILFERAGVSAQVAARTALASLVALVLVPGVLGVLVGSSWSPRRRAQSEAVRTSAMSQGNEDSTETDT